jgi:hypothetical protein
VVRAPHRDPTRRSESWNVLKAWSASATSGSSASTNTLVEVFSFRLYMVERVATQAPSKFSMLAASATISRSSTPFASR